MEQHPIPQNISSYQFRLVGDMTLKQFFQLAGGLLAGFIFYSLPILGIIKWPFAIISVILGIALAFMPLEERPLEKWIFAFFKAIYTPTEFLWKKTETPVKFFQDEPADAIAVLSDKLISTPSLTKLENNEEGFMSKISGIFAGFKSPTSTTAPAPVTVPISTPTQMTPPKPQVAIPTQIPTLQMPVQNQSPVGYVTIDSPATIKPVSTQGVSETKRMEIPQNSPIKIAQPGVPKMVVEEHTPVSFTTQQVAPIIAGNEMVSTKQAIFSVDAAPPSPPVSNNVVVGQAVDQDRMIVEGAIMEIRDSGGRPVRALRSNKLGHFVTVTPLDNGRYDIITEKDGYEFTPVSFEAKGTVIPPILVQGKRVLNEAAIPFEQPIVKEYVPALSPNFQ